MSNFQFAAPNWSAALWGVLAIVVMLLWLDRRRSDALSRFVSPIMQARLVSRWSGRRRTTVILLIGLAACCFVAALMRPQFGLTYVKSPRVGAQIMFCLDVSKSMLAEDAAPNRLQRAKADITDLLTFLDGDQVGLIGFAGRASVLCPLTPDYGFFRLVLEDANPNSVGRGGTRLEEPLRKALDGFRSESDVSRVVFLITDGEDQDSHPLDVAKDAIERGIKVVAVGLGDEAGSEIRITDPRTGIQSQVQDADGRPVITRLDGETLRKLALATEGVYIPAGTGTLDLKSIYDTHIKPLVRNEMMDQGRAIRQDAYQWAILAGLLVLIGALVLGSTPATELGGDQNQPSNRRVAGAAAGVLVAILLAHPVVVLADEDQNPDKASNQQFEIDDVSNPRDTYNLGLGQLKGDLDDAEKLFTKARLDASGDGEVRFRATYNMGWVEVNRAEQLIDQEPEKSLEHLQRSAGWFRDAVRLRKDSADARQNLEIILLRILQLRDQLAKKDAKDIAAAIEALIAAQRKTIGEIRVLVQQTSGADDANIADQFRASFQRLAVDQRVGLSDWQDVTEQAAAELETLESKPEAERTPEETIRVAQLIGVLHYLNLGSQRLGQSRSQLRRRQASRSFRRAAAALNQLKRARDQLRGPLEILDGIISDATTIAQHTRLMSQASPLVAHTDDVPAVPSWIDQDYLVDHQADLTQRTDELTTRLAAGLETGSAAGKSKQNAQQPSAEDDQQQEFLLKLQQAMPHLDRANAAMKLAGEKLNLADYFTGGEQQVIAIESLQEAREQFADLRALIELAYAAEKQIASTLGQIHQDTDFDPQTATESILPLMTANQEKNRKRMERLKQEVVEELAAAQVTPPESDAEPDGKASATRQRYELAKTIVDETIESMDLVIGHLSADKSDQEPAKAANEEVATESTEGDEEQKLTPKSEKKGAATAEAEVAVKKLEDLRRLFFSIVEHLRETAQRQAGLNDDTEQLAGIESEQTENSKTPTQSSAQLASQQDDLAQMADQIADALQKQSEQASTTTQSGGEIDPDQQKINEQDAEKTQQAATLVQAATQQMNEALTTLQDEDPDLAKAREPQDVALEKLIEALMILEPQQDNQQQQDQQEQQQQEQSGQEEPPEPQSEQEQQMDPSRVLQAVRDREAQRRRDRDQRLKARQVPVERDW